MTSSLYFWENASGGWFCLIILMFDAFYPNQYGYE